jgi:hypothetical protein
MAVELPRAVQGGGELSLLSQEPKPKPAAPLFYYLLNLTKPPKRKGSPNEN